MHISAQLTGIDPAICLTMPQAPLCMSYMRGIFERPNRAIVFLQYELFKKVLLNHARGFVAHSAYVRQDELALVRCLGITKKKIGEELFECLGIEKRFGRGELWG